jgi:hypothetical protein
VKNAGENNLIHPSHDHDADSDSDRRRLKSPCRGPSESEPDSAPPAPGRAEPSPLARGSGEETRQLRRRYLEAQADSRRLRWNRADSRNMQNMVAPQLLMSGVSGESYTVPSGPEQKALALIDWCVAHPVADLSHVHHGHGAPACSGACRASGPGNERFIWNPDALT